MTEDSIRRAEEAAREFLRRSAMLSQSDTHYGFNGSRVSGALRRQSMELTRALADMRRASPT